MRESFRAFASVKCIVLALWPITTWAAGESLGQTFGAITLADWLALLVLSGVSGLVALLNRVRISLEAAAAQTAELPYAPADRVRIAWPVFAICHMAGAMFVGLLAFLCCEAMDINNYLEALSIALASWSGAKVADKWADAANDRFAALIAAGSQRGPG